MVELPPVIRLICDIKRQCRKERRAPIIIVPECALPILAQAIDPDGKLFTNPLAAREMPGGVLAVSLQHIMFNGVQFVSSEGDAEELRARLDAASDRWKRLNGARAVPDAAPAA